MKRRILALLLAVLTLTMLTAAAFAEDAEKQGAYNLTGGLKVVGVESDGGFYANADTFELDCTGLTGQYSLVLLLAGSDPVPTEGNIQYIDQTSIEGGKVTFTLKPKALTEGKYYIYISTTDERLKAVASFDYGENPGYMLGDVDGDNVIDAGDALMVLKYEAQLIELSETQKLAANVTAPWKGDSNIDAGDALRILLYEAGLIKSWIEDRQ